MGSRSLFWAARPHTPIKDHGFHKSQSTLRKPWLGLTRFTKDMSGPLNVHKAGNVHFLIHDDPIGPEARHLNTGVQ